MHYQEFERVISSPRMGRYLRACALDANKAMALYRLNLRLTQELYTVLGCFEVALRNAVDAAYQPLLGADWLRDAVAQGGAFDGPACQGTARVIRTALGDLAGRYAHPKLVAELTFGFWRYLFAQPQFNAGGRVLLRAFPHRPSSSPAQQYNNTYFFRELAQLNTLRNRIAHHEPICFRGGAKDTAEVRQLYALVRQLFGWLGVDEQALLAGLDHVEDVCTQIDTL